MLGRLRNRQSTGWKRSLKAVAADTHPVIISQYPADNQSFPWQQLQEHTDAYISKKKRLTPEQIEARLVEYIRDSEDKVDVAIAACGHAIQADTLRTLLAVELNPGPGKKITMNIYLQAIVAANRVNPEAVSLVEAGRAIAMMAAAMTGITAPGQYLQALVRILMEGVPSSFLIYHHLYKLAARACIDFSNQLERLKTDGCLYQAYKAASWLSEVFKRSSSVSPGRSELEQLLDAAFPTWRVWAAWIPDLERLRKWEDRFTPQQKSSLKNVLAFEGPDSCGCYKTLRDGTLARELRVSFQTPWGTVICVGDVNFDDRLSLERLLDIVDLFSMGGPNDIELLSHFCVSETITSNSLNILELTMSTGNALITSLLLDIYGFKVESRSVQMTATMKILPLLTDDRKELKNALTPLLVKLASETMEAMRVVLQDELVHEKLTDTDLKLQLFGIGLKESWILPLLDLEQQTILKEWPTSDHTHAMRYLLNIALRTSPSELLRLKKKVINYFTDQFIKANTLDEPSKHLIEALISIWKQTSENTDLEFVAFYVAEYPDLGDEAHCQGLTLLPTLPSHFWVSFREIFSRLEKKPSQACVDLTNLLKDTPQSEASTIFRNILYGMVKELGRKIVTYTLTHMKAAQWVQFVIDVNTVCGLIEVQIPSPPLMVPSLYSWVQRVAGYTTTLTKIETDLGGAGTVTYLLVYGGPGLDDTLENILSIFAISYKGIYQPAMLALIRLLSVDGSNCADIHEMLTLIVKSSKAGVDACVRLLDLHNSKMTSMVAEVLLRFWLQNPNMDQIDRDTVKALSRLLSLNGADKYKDLSRPPIQNLDVALDYLDKEFAELFAEAQRLENLRSAYKKTNSTGISAMLKKLGVEDPSPVHDFLAELPPALVGVVDMIDDNVVEIQFPLNLSPLQQIAMGVGKAQSLVVRLVLTDHLTPPAFCIHVDNEITTSASESGHQPWNNLNYKIVPDQHPCYGRPSRLTYQLSRIVARHLQTGFKSFEGIHRLVTTALKDMTICCITCGAPRNKKVQRSVTCQAGCSTVFLRSSLEVRLAEIRHDAPTMDLLLTAVHYAAASQKMELLPSCPFSTTLSIETLRKIPGMSTLTHVPDLTVAVRELGRRAEHLLSWAAVSWRGFITSATGNMRIPSMPVGTHQFIVASAAPNLEEAFNAHIGTNPTKVMWHGTSMDRLFAIITQGLKICSGTDLQSHGAASGVGIYTADEPSTSWAYCGTMAPGWTGSPFSNFRVLLGLEAAGNISGSSVYVVKNPSQLMVRYIFLIPTVATMPIAAHVAPAMLSVYNSLRQGAV